MTDAEAMREKQRRAELKAQGIDPDAGNEPVKTYDTSYLDQYYGAEDDEEESKEQDEEEKKEEEPVP